jgi:hypothetical protein
MATNALLKRKKYPPATDLAPRSSSHNRSGILDCGVIAEEVAPCFPQLLQSAFASDYCSGRSRVTSAAKWGLVAVLTTQAVGVGTIAVQDLLHTKDKPREQSAVALPQPYAPTISGSGRAEGAGRRAGVAPAGWAS